MVPYISFPYAEHALKHINVYPNAKASEEYIP